MSLANYLINIDELVDAIRSGFDSPSLLNLGKQRVYGMQLEVDESETQTVAWTVPMDISITSIKFGVNDYRNIGYNDTFDMKINGDIIFEGIHLKEMYEHKRYRKSYQVASGSKIEFIFSNKDKQKKFVWFDIEYIDEEIEVKTVNIICIDHATGEEIQIVQQFIKPPIISDIYAPTLDGFEIFGETVKQVSVQTFSPSVIDIKFEYEQIEEPIDEDIPHDYDWKIILRWQGNCGTDLDLYSYFDNGEIISYQNKNIGTDNNMAWLDYDHTSHNGDTDREDKPEIITLLGKVSNTATIKVCSYTRLESLTEDVTVEIQKREGTYLNTMKTYTIPYEEFSRESFITICDIDLVNNALIDRL